MRNQAAQFICLKQKSEDLKWSLQKALKNVISFKTT